MTLIPSGSGNTSGVLSLPEPLPFVPHQVIDDISFDDPLPDSFVFDVAPLDLPDGFGSVTITTLVSQSDQSENFKFASIDDLIQLMPFIRRQKDDRYNFLFLARAHKEGYISLDQVYSYMDTLLEKDVQNYSFKVEHLVETGILTTLLELDQHIDKTGNTPKNSGRIIASACKRGLIKDLDTFLNCSDRVNLHSSEGADRYEASAVSLIELGVVTNLTELNQLIYKVGNDTDSSRNIITAACRKGLFEDIEDFVTYSDKVNLHSSNFGENYTECVFELMQRGIVNNAQELNSLLGKMKPSSFGWKTVEYALDQNWFNDLETFLSCYDKVRLSHEAKPLMSRAIEMDLVKDEEELSLCIKKMYGYEAAKVLGLGIEKGIITQKDQIDRFLNIIAREQVLDRARNNDQEDISERVKRQRDKDKGITLKVLSKAYKAGIVFDSDMPNIETFFPEHIDGHFSPSGRETAALVRDFIECGYIKTEREFNKLLEKLNETDNGFFEFYYKMIAYREGIIQEKPTATEETFRSFRINNDAEQGIRNKITPESFIREFFETGIITNLVELKSNLSVLENQQDHKTYAQFVEEAYNFGVLVDRESLDSIGCTNNSFRYLVENTLIANNMWNDIQSSPNAEIVVGSDETSEFVEDIETFNEAISRGINPHDGSFSVQLNQYCEQNNLPVEFVISIETLRRTPGLECRDGDIRRVFEYAAKTFKRAREINAAPETREDQQIDLDYFERHCSRGLANLLFISEKVTNHILDANLNQRKNLPMVREIFEIAGSLNPSEVRLLRDLCIDKPKLFQDNQSALIDIIGYMNSYRWLGINLVNSEESSNFLNDLKENCGSPRELTGYLGKRLFREICKPDNLGIDVDIDNIDVRSLLKQWDLQYLGLLISTKKSWSTEDSNLFKLMIKAKMEGTEAGLLYPPDYGKYDLSVYGDENAQQLAQKIRLHNLNFLREMENLGLDPEPWVNAHKVIDSTFTEGRETQRRPIDIVRSFNESFDVLNGWINKNWLEKGSNEKENNLRRDTWQEVLRVRSSWQKESAANNLLGVENRTKLNEVVGGVVNQQIIPGLEDPNNVPEAVDDVRQILEEIQHYDSIEKVSGQNREVGFWDPCDVGHNVFLGNRANSCTAIGTNATAIFYFIPDGGTKYTVISNPSRRLENSNGFPEGYTRIFLALNDDESPRPIIYMDSTDGITANRNMEHMRAHVVKLAERIGLSESDVRDRDGSATNKVGGSLSYDYFHHAGEMDVKPAYIEDVEELESWAREKGWLKDK